MQAPRRRDISLPVAGQVTSLELFFDLVFVFTITQLTATVLSGGWAVTARTALLLLLLWWMYGGYAWLTNAAPPVTPVRRGFSLPRPGGDLPIGRPRPPSPPPPPAPLSPPPSLPPGGPPTVPPPRRPGARRGGWGARGAP